MERSSRHRTLNLSLDYRPAQDHTVVVSGSQSRQAGGSFSRFTVRYQREL
ncbi:MAG: hypothetical protein GKR89_07545 [Candidatus Latescibacteria bacterium]|nr:hypothetical protein [Candidatus Latescibacterota bacterium]